jgi:predicted nucleotidyltransferase
MNNINLHPEISKLVERFSKLPEVEGVLLAGSRVTGAADIDSDYDLYVYTNLQIDVSKREEITRGIFKRIELNNQFWETEDDGMLEDGSIPVDIVYRDLHWVVENISETILLFRADTGYTTCIWGNFISSIILFERKGAISSVQNRFRIQYPVDLKINIIRKNLPLLKWHLPSYYFQVEKALKRNDVISVNHRLAAFFASYFDTLFAINEIPHPGEKKLLEFAGKHCHLLPNNYVGDIHAILANSVGSAVDLLYHMDRLITNLEDLIHKQNIPV